MTRGGGGQREASGWWTTQQEEGGGCKKSGWQAMQGDWAANDTTRGGGRGHFTTQQEARVDDAGQSDKARVDNAGQLDGGRLKEGRGVENPTWRQMSRQAKGSRRPNVAADDMTIDNGRAAVAKMAFNFAVVCNPLATFAYTCSVVCWLLHCTLLLLLFASVCHLLLPCYLCCSLLCCWLVVVLRAAAHHLHFCCCLLCPCTIPSQLSSLQPSLSPLPTLLPPPLPPKQP